LAAPGELSGAAHNMHIQVQLLPLTPPVGGAYNARSIRGKEGTMEKGKHGRKGSSNFPPSKNSG